MILRFYKKYISILYRPCCRFYPSCSEYAALCFAFQNPILAIFNTAYRLLRCNQLCAGGIEHPTLHVLPRSTYKSGKKVRVVTWFVPCKHDRFYIIKTL